VHAASRAHRGRAGRSRLRCEGRAPGQRRDAEAGIARHSRDTHPGGSMTGAATDHDAVAIHGLRKVFGSLVAIDGLELSIHRGEVFGLLGPNAPGQTTTSRM